MSRIFLNLTEDSRRRVFSEESLRRLVTLGETVTFDPKTETAEAFRTRLADADVMLTCWGSRPVSADDLADRGVKPLLVAHAAGSVRGVMLRELLTSAIRLTQGAAAMVPAVAQFTVGLMVMALRQSYGRMLTLKGDVPKDPTPRPYRDLDGLTVSIIGLSRVGVKVAELLRPFGCRILAYDPYWTTERAAALGVELLPDLDAVVARADVLSLHAPVTDETRNLLDARRIALIQPGTAFINTARGVLVDQDALFARAYAGEVEAYLDVTVPEPLPPDHLAWQCPHIFITPHIAGPTEQTLRRMAEIAVSEIERYLRGEPLQHEVTAERYDLLA